MKKFTVEDIKNFEKDEYGYTICPSGDYSEITWFSNKCVFAENCVFGRSCMFGGWCKFGEKCTFGEWCSFGELCKFGKLCNFDSYCRFGEWCDFGKNCSFENERVKNGKYFACDRIGSKGRKTYFFCDEYNEIFVRAGCFFGTEKEFLEELKETHGNTKYERQYKLALELAKDILLEGIKNEEVYYRRYKNF